MGVRIEFHSRNLALGRHIRNLHSGAFADLMRDVTESAGRQVQQQGTTQRHRRLRQGAQWKGRRRCCHQIWAKFFLLCFWIVEGNRLQQWPNLGPGES